MSYNHPKGHPEQLFSLSAQLAVTGNVEMTTKPMHHKIPTTGTMMYTTPEIINLTDQG